MAAHAYGEPLGIIKFNGAASLEFDRSGLESLLLHPDVESRKVVVLSIVGAFRKGKTFFLDYCLRYLYAHVSSKICLIRSNSKNFHLIVQVSQTTKHSGQRWR